MGDLTDAHGRATTEPGFVDAETFQVSSAQAEAYEEHFVPALFGQWVEPVLGVAAPRPGDRVLDVACGTGVVARAAAARVAPGGAVIGVDVNPAMLAVARRVAPELDWRQGDVAALPFGSGAFDRVVCQAAIFFFPDPLRALSEMGRVTRPGGRVVVQAFSSLAEQPAYGPWVDLVARHAGSEALALLGAYWSQGDAEALGGRCREVGLRVTDVQRHVRPAYFRDVETMVRTEVSSTPLQDRLDEVSLDAILTESQELLGQFVVDDRLVVPLAGYVLAASPD